MHGLGWSGCACCARVQEGTLNQTLALYEEREER
jgi:hypothetical protein